MKSLIFYQSYINIKLLPEQSENIVKYYGWKLENNITYHIYLEFCEGGNLKDIMDKMKADGKKFSSSEIINIFKQLLSAL